MPAKQHPARSSFKHYGIAITVEMINPKVGLDGLVNINPGRYTYRIPLNKRGAVVDVVGLITHATFEVSGWRHPIQFTTTNMGIGDPVIIQHIALGKLGALGIMEYHDIDLDGLPLGKIREHARRAATFTGTLKTRKTNKAIPSRHPYIRIKELNDQPIQNMKIGGVLDGGEHARFGAKLNLDNVRVFLPMGDPRALKEVAKHYEQYYKIGRDAAGYVTCAKYISIQTGRALNTIQPMITLCRADKHLPKPTKRKRGTK